MVSYSGHWLLCGMLSLALTENEFIDVTEVDEDCPRPDIVPRGATEPTRSVSSDLLPDEESIDVKSSASGVGLNVLLVVYLDLAAAATAVTPFPD